MVVGVLCLSPATAVFADTDTTPPTASFPGPFVWSTSPVSQTYMLGLYATDDTGVTYADVYLDDQKLTLPQYGISMTKSDTPSGTFIYLNWDTTQIANGTYEMRIKVFDAAGNAAWATNITNDYVVYLVQNTTQAPTPVAVADEQKSTSATTPSLCKISQDKIDKLTQGISSRKSKRVDTMNDIETQLEKYYVSHQGKSQDYSTDLSSVYQAKAQAQSAVADLLQNDMIDCRTTPAAQLADFKERVTATTDTIDAYQDSLHQLIDTIDAAIK